MLTAVHLYVSCMLAEEREGTKFSLHISEPTVTIQERAWHDLNDSPMKTAAQQQKNPNMSSFCS